MTFIFTALAAAFLATLYIVRRAPAGACTGGAAPGVGRLTPRTQAANLRRWRCAGVLYDFTHQVRPSIRLAAAFVSGVLGGLLMNAWETGIEVHAMDAVLALPVVAIAFSMALVAGMVNAFNIIDGFNQLAGDVANLIMLVVGNTGVSTWFPLLLYSYPVCEMLFSIYRQIFFRRAHPHTPDMAHLHHLIYKRVVRWLVRPGPAWRREHGNPYIWLYVWVVTLVGVAPDLMFWQKTLLRDRT